MMKVNVKELDKKPGKDPDKELGEEQNKELIKEQNKEQNKELIKELDEEFSKELAKESAGEWGKKRDPEQDNCKEPAVEPDIRECAEDGFWQGVKDCIPTLLGYLSIGFAAGVVGKTAGLSVLEIALMSILIYAGSAQFIVAGMIAANGSALAIVFTVFIVNLRHLLLSAALSPYFRHLATWKTVLIGALVTDETFGVAINQPPDKQKIDERWMHGLNVTAYVNWIMATTAGAFLGQWISDPEKFGLDFALPAMLIGLLVLQMMTRKKIRVDLIVACSAGILVIALSQFLSGSIAVMLATVGAATVGMMVEKWK